MADKTLADPQVLRHYLAQLGGLNVAALGNDELEAAIVDGIDRAPVSLSPSSASGLRLVQALLEARLQVRCLESTLADVHGDFKAARTELELAQAEAIQVDRQADRLAWASEAGSDCEEDARLRVLEQEGEPAP